MQRLSDIYDELLRNAFRTGQDRHADLPRGARLAVRVEPRGEGGDPNLITGYQITLTIARKNARLGDRELHTFKRDCKVPLSALRWPAEGQHTQRRDGAAWWIVVFRWIAPKKKKGA